VPGRDDGVVRGARTPAKRFGVLRIRHWNRDPRVLVPGALVGMASGSVFPSEGVAGCGSTFTVASERGSSLVVRLDFGGA
jgi:hypothetical protein